MGNKFLLTFFFIVSIFSCKIEDEEIDKCPIGPYESNRVTSFKLGVGNVIYGSETIKLSSTNSVLIDSVEMYEATVSDDNLEIFMRIDKITNDGCRNTIKPKRIEFEDIPSNGNFFLEVIGIDKTNPTSPDTFRVSNFTTAYGDVQYSSNSALLRIEDIEMDCDTGITLLSISLPITY